MLIGVKGEFFVCIKDISPEAIKDESFVPCTNELLI